MPKEQITRDKQRYMIDGSALDPKANDSSQPFEVTRENSYPSPQLSLAWMGGEGGGWVQAMFTLDKRQIQKVLDDAAKYPHDTDDPEYLVNIYTEVLSREDVNKLIRVGRRARDRSYGRDE